MSSPVKNLSQVRKTPLPGFRSSQRWAAANSRQDLAVYQVFEYLTQYPDVLEEYLLEYASLDLLEDVLKKKTDRVGDRCVCVKTPNIAAEPKIKWDVPFSEIGMKHLCQRIIDCLTDTEIYERIHEMCRLVASITDADDFSMYVNEATECDLARFDPGSKQKIQHVGPIGYRMTVSAHVAAEKKAINATDIPQDARFPKGVRLGDTTAHHVICVPILLECGSVYGVVELIRGWESMAFSTREFDMTLAILSWIMACVQKFKLNKLLSIQTRMNNYLLESSKVLFDDIDNIDNLVTNIMTFTKDLVSAERCSLFLVDEERKELFADYFDEGKQSDTGIPLYTKRSQIRFPNNRGIAGYVASTGKSVNILDAYSDDRFNRDIDKKTGYQTRNILCMPISGRNGVLGVVQMLNRQRNDHFTQEDEAAFQMFAVYCAIALHYSRIYNLLSHQQAKYKVAMEVLHYHMSPSEESAKNLIENPIIPDEEIPANFYNYDFCCYDYDALLPKLFIRMMQNMFPNVFEMKTLCNFILTVRKNYRNVAYHNWQHGFHVAHSCWRILDTCKEPIFSNLEKMGMIVAGICHDIDHRGYNNDFLKKQRHPLAALYSTSTMEQHHYKQTVTILHAEGNDIFSFLTAEQHREMLELIRKYILATDLSMYFANQKTLNILVKEQTFDLSNPEHKDCLVNLVMTGADLCAVTKPWETQKRTADYIYEEFYTQGDEEKKSGLQPIPMMDRVNREDIPKQQIGFSNFICLPAYTTLSTLLPGTKPLLEGCIINCENWNLLVIEKTNKMATL